MEIEDYADLEKVLREVGYSNAAIEEIVKWYSNKAPNDLL